MPIGMLIDTTKCVLCRSCQVECQKFYVEDGRIKDTPFPGTSITPELDIYHYVVLQVKQVQQGERTRIVGVSKRCMHCLNPACVSVCPVGALNKEENGAVVWDTTKCIGCRYCQNACPFDIPKFEWEEPWPIVSKCIFCNDRKVANGENPICADACPTQAIRFGDRDELLALAKERISDNPDRYYNHVYGENEVGGTSVMYIGAVAPKQLGFAAKTEDEEYPPFTWEFLSRVPYEVIAIAIVLGGIYFFRSRRMAKMKDELDKH